MRLIRFSRQPAKCSNNKNNELQQRKQIWKPLNDVLPDTKTLRCSFIIFVYMNLFHSVFTNEQRITAIQRLTALWAFTESGLGGIMHALQIPFTGLVIGGMAVVMISMIAVFSNGSYKQVLKSVMVVLIVKAMVAPLTPPTAYIAVSFQALLGFSLFSLFQVNLFSIFLLSILAMLESALQKLLVLVLFFGESLWKAMDNLVAFAVKQLGHITSNGSFWIIGIYLFIYTAGGIFIAWFAYRIINNFNAVQAQSVLSESTCIILQTGAASKKSRYKKIRGLLLIMLLLSVVLFFVPGSNKRSLLEVLKQLTWTLSAILIWFLLLGPLVTKMIQKILKKNERRYSEDVSAVLSTLPLLHTFAYTAWQQSKHLRGFKRFEFFFTSLIYSTLTLSGPIEQPVEKKSV